MRSLKEIENDSFHKMEDYHQISIDFIHDANELCEEVPETQEEKNDLINSLHALSYNIYLTLEVYNPIFEIEINDLKLVYDIIEEKIKELELLSFKKYD